MTKSSLGHCRSSTSGTYLLFVPEQAFEGLIPQSPESRSQKAHGSGIKRYLGAKKQVTSKFAFCVNAWKTPCRDSNSHLRCPSCG